MESMMNVIMHISATAAGSLVNAIAEGVVLVVAVILCLRLVPRMTAAARFVVWAAALLLVVPLHFLPALRSGSGPDAAVSDELFHLDPRWSLVIAGVWLAFSLVRAIQLVSGAVKLRQIARRAVPVAVNFDASLLQSGGRTAEICVSEDVDRPSVTGFLSPRILLPAALLEKLSPRELEQIVRHEMEHLRRRDDWTNLMQKVGLVLFPLNPVMSWVERRMCVERELACDDCVLRATKARKDYATCLTNLAEHSLMRRGVSLALGAWERQSELSQRVHRILSRPEAMFERRQARIVTGVLIAGMMGGAVVLVGSPQLISFTPAAGHGQKQAANNFQAESNIQAESSAEASPSMHGSDPGGATPTLVKAVMPENRPAVRALPKPHGRSAPALVKRRALTRQTASWVVLTNWESAAPQPRLMMTRSLVAVVPTGDGWLVIQL